MFYIGGRNCVLCQFIEPVTFERCAFIFALRNIALGGYLDTRRNILEHLRHDVRPETDKYRKSVALNASLAINCSSPPGHHGHQWRQCKQFIIAIFGDRRERKRTRFGTALRDHARDGYN